ncbi:hypothetical protein [Adhaeribacter soli]|uniref:Uncharacterized protein n=1 Tax=Adhaeribacter soli TaxID=2607655 RepID=A0A5N1IZ57_9BACT|nr:hypothetical protein [Adhaeribacter soli]KAA9333779.1 hypothetical protein F0P94_11075 [Adhaeribacter soli]
MKKFLEVNEDNIFEKDLVNKWISDCHNSLRPCIVVYYHDDLAHISANISHLLNLNKSGLQEELNRIDQDFFMLGIDHFHSSLHFWKVNDHKFTFDDIPRDKALVAAHKIYDILERRIRDLELK